MIGQNYLEFLQNELPGKLENIPSAIRIAMYFQHDADPPHYIRLVMQHLNDTFPNWWISRGSTFNWPAKSPDRAPLDFCLWSWMTSEVYRRNVGTWDKLLDRIMDAIARIKERQDELRRATRHVPARVAKCTEISKIYYELTNL
jgi:hypothetical protein